MTSQTCHMHNITIRPNQSKLSGSKVTLIGLCLSIYSVYSTANSSIAYWGHYINQYLQTNALNPHPETPVFNPLRYSTWFSSAIDASSASSLLNQQSINFSLSENVEPLSTQQLQNINVTPNNQQISLSPFGGTISIPPDNSLVNINYLINSLPITDNSAEQINHKLRIYLLTHFWDPITIEHTAQGNQSDHQKSLVAAWNLMTQTSTSLSNYHHILSKKTKTADLGQSVALSAQLTLANDTSLSDLEAYLSQFKVRDGTWSSSHQQSSSFALEKSILFQNATLYAQLFQRFQERERLLATLSLLQAQNLTILKKWQAINLEIQKASGSIPGLTVPSVPSIPPVDPDSGSSSSGDSHFDGSSLCFIATHIYGQDSWQVIKLRQYRDETLLQHTWGYWLTESYYMFSPDAVKWLKEQPEYKKVTRYFLNAIISYL